MLGLIDMLSNLRWFSLEFFLLSLLFFFIIWLSAQPTTTVSTASSTPSKRSTRFKIIIFKKASFFVRINYSHVFIRSRSYVYTIPGRNIDTCLILCDHILFNIFDCGVSTKRIQRRVVTLEWTSKTTTCTSHRKSTWRNISTLTQVRERQVIHSNLTPFWYFTILAHYFVTTVS